MPDNSGDSTTPELYTFTINQPEMVIAEFYGLDYTECDFYIEMFNITDNIQPIS